MPSIGELPRRLGCLEPSLRSLVAHLYQVEELEGDLEVPEPLRPKAARWCSGGASAPEAWRQVQRQRVVSVHAAWTFETANFNALRACRPVGGPQCAEDGPDEIAETCSGPDRCDFCDLERLTCVEPFGRVHGRHSRTAGNAFKSSGLHGLVVWQRHHPHRLTDDEILDGFETADTWFSRATACASGGGPSGANYRVMFWNCFRSGGASQVHPHMQLQLFRRPVAQGALLREQSAAYRRGRAKDAPGSGDLLLDVVEAHRALGLALDIAGALCWASLTPRAGGGELCALALAAPASEAERVAPLASAAPAVAALLRALRRQGAEGLSVVAMPVPVKGSEAWLVRCVPRGRACPGVVDVGSAELAGLTGVSTDPYALFGALEAEVAQGASVDGAAAGGTS